MARLRRALAALTIATAPVAALAGPGAAAPAAAVTPGVGFTADSLPTYQTNGIAWSVAQANGVVYVGGTFSSVRPPGVPAGTSETAAANFVALDAATGNPTGCKLSFTGTAASVRALGLSPDKRTLYAAGLFSAVNGSAAFNVAAVNLTTCAPITTFRPQVNTWVRGMTVAPNGNVYLAGEFGTVNGQVRQRFAAFSPAGALLPFAPAANLNGYAVAITPDGSKAVLGGAFTTVNAADSHALAIVDATTGANVRTYPANFVPTTSAVKSVYADASGIYTGNEGTGGGAFDGRIALDPTTFNQRWRDLCLGATQHVLVDGSNLYAANHAHDCTNMGGFPNGRRQHLTVEGTNDPHLKVWWPDTNDGLGEGIGPRALAITTAGTRRYFVAVGEFTTVNGVAQQGILRLADGPDTGAPPAPLGLTASTAVAGRVQLRWLASTDRDDATLTYRVYKNSSTTPVATFAADSDWWKRPQLQYVDTAVTAGTLYTYKVTATDSSGNVSGAPSIGVRPSASSSRYASAVLADSPSLYWRYNDPAGTLTLGDDSPAGNGALLQGTRTPAVTPAALAGDSSTAMGFNGSTGYGYQAQPEAAPSSYTVETWFQTTTTTGGKLVGFGNNTTRGSTVYDRHIYMRDDGRLVFGTTGTTSALTSTAAYNDGQWHHVVGSQGAAGTALYVDGVSVATGTQKTNTIYQGYWRVGGDTLGNWPGPHTSTFFNGKLDETAVYRTALTSARIAAHYQASGRAVGTPDTTAPTAPGTPTATVNGSNVALTWPASTDDVAVSGYTVHRSSTPGFAPSATTSVADVTGTSYTDPARPAGTWYYRVVASDAARNTSAPSPEVAATVASPDTTAPSAPSSPSATVTGPDVAVRWTASTDDRGVTGYRVYRSSTPGVAPSTATQVAQVTATSWTDLGRPAGTWYYVVAAVDAAGNLSAPSTEVSGTVAAGSVTQAVAPTEDTYVNSSATTTNAGTSTQLAATGSGVVSYLRFPLPAAPAGTVLKSASLRVQTSSTASAGSVDSQPITLGPGGWTEATLTWANRPAAPSPATTVGTISGATAVSTAYTTPLDAAVVSQFAGADLNLTVRGSGTDSLWLWSRQAATTQRPQLTLVYGAP